MGNNLINHKVILTVLLGLMLLLASFLAGYFFQKSQKPSNSPTTNLSQQTKASQTPQTSASIKSSPIFNSQSAVIQGKIVSLSGNSVVVENNQGQKDSFLLAPTVAIYLPKLNSSISTLSSNLKNLKLNTESSITLQMMDNDFKITSVVYSNPTLR